MSGGPAVSCANTVSSGCQTQRKCLDVMICIAYRNTVSIGCKLHHAPIRGCLPDRIT
jgi:hypothetical protein